MSPDGNRMMAAATLETDTVAIIGGTVVALVTVVVIVITVLIAIAMVIKRRRADSEVNPNQRYVNINYWNISMHPWPNFISL